MKTSCQITELPEGFSMLIQLLNSASYVRSGGPS